MCLPRVHDWSKLDAVLVLTLFLFANSALAGHEGVEQVLQPLALVEGDLIVADVAYVTAGSRWDSPGVAVVMTASPNAVGLGSTSSDRNAASQAGISLSLEPGRYDETFKQRFEGLCGDTLRVRVDLSGIARSEPPLGHSAESWRTWLRQVVSLTLKCGIWNASRSWPRIKFVHYEITGSTAFAEYRGTYTLEGVTAPSAPFQDSEGLKPAGAD